MYQQELFNLLLQNRIFLYDYRIAYLEIIRRSIWNLLKIQREHTKGCQKYQAVLNYRHIQDNVQKNVFQPALSKYITNIETLYLPLKEEDIIQENKDRIIVQNDKFYLKTNNPFQMKAIVKHALLESDMKIMQQRKKQQLSTLNKKVQTKRLNKKSCKLFIKNKQQTIFTLQILLNQEIKKLTNNHKTSQHNKLK